MPGQRSCHAPLGLRVQPLIDGLEPANGYDIVGSSGLDGTWQSHGRIPPAANGEARYRTTLSLPVASRRFLKITPAP